MTNDLCPLCEQPIDPRNVRIDIDGRTFHWACVIDAARQQAIRRGREGRDI